MLPPRALKAERCGGGSEGGSKCCAAARSASGSPTSRRRRPISACWDLRSGYSEPHRYIPALRAKLEDMGVEIRENEPVVGFDIRNGRVRGVVTDRGTIESDAAVSAVNAWTNHVLSLVGFRTPYKNFVHERFVTKPFPEPPRLPAVK